MKVFFAKYLSDTRMVYILRFVGKIFDELFVELKPKIIFSTIQRYFVKIYSDNFEINLRKAIFLWHFMPEKDQKT